MSYILDALRKAESERERGSAPNIHAPNRLSSEGYAHPGPDKRAVMRWVLAAVMTTVLVGVALLWYVQWPSSNPAAPVAGQTANDAPAALPATDQAVSTAKAPAQSPAEKQAAPPRVAIKAPASNKRLANAPPTKAAEAPAKALPSASAPAKVDNPVMTLVELPDDVRRQLPTVSVNGSVYSPKAADRVLIVNGLVLHEGDTVAPGLVLQQIQRKGAVLGYKGYRYSISY
jgi:general secretion pathway protein B